MTTTEGRRTITAESSATASTSEWQPEAHTGLPRGFSLWRRENPDMGAADYRIAFQSDVVIAMSHETEADREHRDWLLRDALHRLAHYIRARIEELE